MLLATSYNGGEKFNLSAFGVHPDLHDMWISSDGNRMALAGDGGIAISANGGATWSNSRNIAIGQVYRVGLSNTIPYLVCGGLQDNNAYCGPAFNGNFDGITNRDWFKVTEGDGEWAVPDPTNSRLIWADSENGETRRVRPRLASIDERETVSWNRARRFRSRDVALSLQLGIADCFRRIRSPRRPSSAPTCSLKRAIGGKHWKAISPDLTRNDKSKQQVAKNSVTHDESGAENYGTILDIETSARRKGEIWTGSDDGLVYLTRDGGVHWRNVTPPGLPRR